MLKRHEEILGSVGLLSGPMIIKTSPTLQERIAQNRKSAKDLSALGDMYLDLARGCNKAAADFEQEACELEDGNA